MATVRALLLALPLTGSVGVVGCAGSCSGAEAPTGAAPATDPPRTAVPATSQTAAPAAPAANAATAVASTSCLEWLRSREQSSTVAGPEQTLICRADDDAATRELTNRLASRGARPELVVPVIDGRCRLERVCGNFAGVDCDSAVDGPYVYYEMTGWTAVAHCGGHCMGGRCTNCPPAGFNCPTY